jgi:hypothetical protein
VDHSLVDRCVATQNGSNDGSPAGRAFSTGLPQSAFEPALSSEVQADAELEVRGKARAAAEVAAALRNSLRESFIVRKSVRRALPGRLGSAGPAGRGIPASLTGARD